MYLYLTVGPSGTHLGKIAKSMIKASQAATSTLCLAHAGVVRLGGVNAILIQTRHPS
jgi:hypothetical protein